VDDSGRAPFTEFQDHTVNDNVPSADRVMEITAFGGGTCLRRRLARFAIR